MGHRQYDLDSLHGRIAWALEQSGKGQTQVAEAIGCTHSAISQWKSGTTRKIDAQLLQAYADQVGVELRWLLTGERPVRSRYMLTDEMQRMQEAISVLAREAPLQVETVVRMVEAAASQRNASK